MATSEWVRVAMPAVVTVLWTLLTVGTALAAMLDAPGWTRGSGGVAALCAAGGLALARRAA